MKSIGRELCLLASEPTGPSVDRKGVPRTCGSRDAKNAHAGKTVHRLAACASCTFHSTEPDAGERENASRVALPVLRPCANGGREIVPGGACPTCGSGDRHVRTCAVKWSEHAPGLRDGVCTWEETEQTDVMSCRECQGDGLHFRPRAGAAAPPGAKPKRPRFVTVPPLPALDLPPARGRRALVTVATGEAGRAMLEISRPYHEAYAARIGAEYLVLDQEPPVPELALSTKFLLGGLLDTRERVVFLDADAMPLPGCPDVGAMVYPGEFGFHDDQPGLNRVGGFSVRDEYHEQRKALGLHAARCDYIANTGVLVFDRSHRAVFDRPTGPIPLRHCAEQTWYTIRLHDLGVRVRHLPPACNYQFWEWDGFNGLPPTAGVILHFSGIVPRKPNGYRLDQMRRWAGRVPPPEWEPPPHLFGPPHLGSADRRHVRWIHRELMSGRYRRVLEIGCFLGYSTCALLSACLAGRVDEVHLCDPYVTPDLERVIAWYGLGDRVTIHRRRSVDLLAEDARWDLVFVDGDHSAANVREETRLLLAHPPAAVFVHDTRGKLMFPDCDGPELLVAALREAGYECAEDAERREGEWTERGMLLALRR